MRRKCFSNCSSISLPKHEPCKAKDLVGQGQGLLLKANALTFKAKTKAKDLTLKAKAKDLAFKAKAKAKDSKFVLEDRPRPRTKAKDNKTEGRYSLHKIFKKLWLGEMQCFKSVLALNLQ